MYIFYSLSDFPMLDYAVVTSGTFDGLHLGHQKIIERLCQIAKEKQGKTIVITFFPQPRMILSKQEVKELFTLDETEICNGAELPFNSKDGLTKSFEV